MNIYDVLVDIIDRAILDDDVETLKENLSRLPFEKINQSNLDLLLTHFINLSQSTMSIKTIFNVWYDYLPMERGQLDHLTRLFTDITVTPDALQLVAKSQDKDAEYYFAHLIEYDSSPITMIAAKNIEKLFPVVNWQYLFDITVNKELQKGYINRLIKDFIENKLTETRPYKRKPTWVNNVYDYVPYFKNLKKQYQLNYEKSLELTIREITNKQLNAIIGEDGLDEYLNASNKKKKELLRPHMLAIYRYNMNFNTDMFRIFGPANTQLDEVKELDENHICSIYGGHRIYECRCFEIMYINDEEVDVENELADWFTGRCDRCFDPIKYKHYAVREPLYNGGWLGCYCSFKCLREAVPPDNIVDDLVNIFEEQIKTIGIQDRRY